MKTIAAIVLLCLVGAAPTRAAVSMAQLDDVEAEPLPDASLPLGLTFIDENGNARTLGAAVGETPAVLVFTDYGCTNLCGPILAFAAAGLAESGLAPGEDFHLVVIGLDPRRGPDQARAIKASRLEGNSALAAATAMLIGEPDVIAAATRAAGYHYVYDVEHDQFAHPAAAYVLTREGRIAHVLSGLGLDGRDLRLALIDAAQGGVGSLIDRITLRCFGFDPARGIYTASITRLLAIAGAGTVVALIGGISLMGLAMGRRRRS